nr:ATP-binding cassette domain-containing protein [Candidatus Latescibacterota bacterium]NIM66183.1 ATP-binding cassette domain-containing protein [Candidatus Latescibacterota bacterium]NIT01279.1 ATP-binding cassette domain-containing protein [Candidatus Latescibacterota bacterium]NIT38779.1 ATP-binding cassette domain-containing protein [Candidatus Latescibacterota bacterium]
MAEALLAVEDIEIHYGSASVLKIPSLAVLPGEVLALIGPNGAGKSTLIRVIGLLERPERGQIYFRGVEVAHRDAPALRKRIATVFQEPLLLNSTVYENAALGLKLRGLEREAIERRVQPWLERLGISHLVRRRARSLSGGEAQRT